MELNHTYNAVESSGVITSNVFGIDGSNPMAYEILSSRIYTKPVHAIVREISCNAYDAHVVAGNKETPFEVHLPNSLAPYFSVKDYGTGLSPEQVGNLYTVYFRSDKTKSNNVIGCYGLGCKTPYSYSDAFEVIVRYNGKRYMYSMFKNETGIPQHSLLGVFDTDEPNGVEVKVPVQHKDFTQFYEAARAQLRYFDVPPKVTGSPYERVEFPKNSFKGSNWVFSLEGYGHSVTVVQGYVGYSFDFDQIGERFPEEYKFFVDNIRQTTLFMNIGEFDTAVSREEVQYTERTKTAVYNALRAAFDEFANTLKDEITTIATQPGTEWQRAAGVRKYAMKFGFHAAKQFLSFYKDDPVVGKYVDEFKINLGSAVNLFKYSRHGRSNKFRSTPIVQQHLSLIPNDSTIIFVVDQRRRAKDRIISYLESKGIGSSTDVFSLIHKDLEPADTKLSYSMKDDIAEVITTLGEPETIYVSTLPLPPKKSSTYTYGVKVNVFDGLNYRSYGQSVRWADVSGEALEEILGEDKLYVLTEKRINIITPSDIMSIDKEAKSIEKFVERSVSLINEYTGTSYKHTDIVFIPSTYKRVLKETEWVDLFDVLKTAAASAHKDVVAYQKYETIIDKSSFKSSDIFTDFVYNALQREIDTNSLFLETIEKMRDLKKSSDAAQRLSNLVSFIHTLGLKKPLTKDEKEDIEETSTILISFFERYPLLKYYPFYGMINSVGTGKFHDLVDYINLVDRSN